MAQFTHQPAPSGISLDIPDIPDIPARRLAAPGWECSTSHASTSAA
jgi:hypothetical protein